MEVRSLRRSTITDDRAALSGQKCRTAPSANGNCGTRQSSPWQLFRYGNGLAVLPIDDGTANAYTEWAQSWTVAYTLTDMVGAYTGWYAIFPHNAETTQAEHYFDGGFTYLINNDIQFDIRVGKGMNAAAANYFVGTGLSIRFQ